MSCLYLCRERNGDRGQGYLLTCMTGAFCLLWMRWRGLKAESLKLNNGGSRPGPPLRGYWRRCSLWRTGLSLWSNPVSPLHAPWGQRWYFFFLPGFFPFPCYQREERKAGNQRGGLDSRSSTPSLIAVQSNDWRRSSQLHGLASPSLWWVKVWLCSPDSWMRRIVADRHRLTGRVEVRVALPAPDVA